MARTTGRLGVLRRIEGRVTSGDAGAVTIAGSGVNHSDVGFTGFDVNIQGTSEQIPGGGSKRTRDTGHKTGTCSYAVDHIGAAKVLWDKHAHRVTYLFQEQGSATVERYHGYDSITIDLNAGSADTYTVEVTMYEDVAS